MTEQKSVSVALIDACSRLAWPLIAIVALYTFRPPLEQILYRAAAQLQGGASVELAGLKIELPRSNLPKPPDRVTGILAQLDSEEIEYILSNMGGDQNVSNCYAQTTQPDAFAVDSAESRLVKLNLMTRQEILIPFKADDGSTCNSGSTITYESIYTLTRDYLIDILTSLRFGDSSAESP